VEAEQTQVNESTELNPVLGVISWSSQIEHLRSEAPENRDVDLGWGANSTCFSSHSWKDAKQSTNTEIGKEEESIGININDGVTEISKVDLISKKTKAYNIAKEVNSYTEWRVVAIIILNVIIGVNLIFLSLFFVWSKTIVILKVVILS